MAFAKDKYRQLLQEIKDICHRCGRDESGIKILAATKYADVDDINAAISAGIDVIGENRLQDAQRKFSQILPVEKRFIGHLQTNKVRLAVQLFDFIESVDSFKLAEKINEEAVVFSKIMPVLLEVNIASDINKFGLKPEEVKPLLKKISGFKNLKVRGLMTIVPFSENIEDVRPFFSQMNDLFELCRAEYPAFDTLSMGMSHDFRVAIEEGATEIRIGSYLFK